MSEDHPQPGTSFTMSAAVRNAGDGDAGVTTLRFFRSQDATITPSDAAEGTGAVAALDAGARMDAAVTLKAPDEPGTYYYGACVDEVAGEADTTNNCSDAVAVTVVDPPSPVQDDPPVPDDPPEPDPQTAPDLRVATPAVSEDHPQPGTSFTMSTAVRNAGDGDAGATTLRFFRSQDATITPSDAAEGTGAIAALDAGARVDASVTRTAPDEPGTYYYGACVDEVAGEIVTTNNCSDAVAVTVVEPPPPVQVDPPDPEPQTAPDLRVATPAVSDDHPDAGSSFTISAAVRNAGDGDAGATTLRFFRSLDATITPSDAAEGTGAIAALDAGARVDAAVTLTAPDEPGTYYYGACVDEVAGEADTTNNCSEAVAVTVAEPPPPVQVDPPEPEPQTAPDLRVATPAVSDDHPDAGTSFTTTSTVRNAGDGDAGATTLRFFRSLDATITTSDAAVGTGAVTALDAGARRNVSVTLTAPDEPGTYYYGACVDRVVREADTTNNCSGAVAVTVEDPSPPVQVDPPDPEPQTAPDLRVATPAVSDDHPDAGTSFTIYAAVRNTGDGDAGATTLRFFRSLDATVTPSDAAEGTGAVAALDAGARRNVSVTLTAPDEPGTYYYGACVDMVAGEVDTTNNCSGAVAVTVAELPPPVQGDPPATELHLFRPDSVKEDIGDGTLVVVAWTKNGRSAPAESILVRVWLVSGTADEGVDFGRFNHLIEFKRANFEFKENNNRYEAIKQISFTVLDDTEAEGDETLGVTMRLENGRPFVTLLSPDYPEQLYITILDNDD